MKPKKPLRARPCAAAAVVVVAGLTACGTTSPPREELAAADLAVREADEAEAGTHAPAPLRRARDKLDEARAAMQAEEYVRARRLAEQALVDAQLAQAEARSAIAQNQVSEMRESIDDLRREAMGES
jgi:hypothetical protein